MDGALGLGNSDVVGFTGAAADARVAWRFSTASALISAHMVLFAGSIEVDGWSVLCVCFKKPSAAVHNGRGVPRNVKLVVPRRSGLALGDPDGAQYGVELRNVAHIIRAVPASA